MMNIEELPISVQTLYADLVQRAWSGNLSAITSGGGSTYSREVKGRLYWYWQPPTDQDGKRPSARYIGPDNAQTKDLRVKEDCGQNPATSPSKGMFFT